MIVPPGSTIGIVGGGQLGRMLAMAAAQLGYRCHVYAPDETAPAAEVAARFTRGAFDDEAALARFAAEVDVVTYEFENIPTGPLAALAAQRAAPSADRGAGDRAGPARGEGVRRRRSAAARRPSPRSTTGPGSTRRSPGSARRRS